MQYPAPPSFEPGSYVLIPPLPGLGRLRAVVEYVSPHGDVGVRLSSGWPSVYRAEQLTPTGRA